MTKLTRKQKEAIQTWLIGLRSGLYAQGINRLKIKNKYCCLGVACDLFADKVAGKWIKGNEEDHFQYFDGSLAVITCIPWELGKFLSLSTNVTVALAFFNDNGATFEDIANIIEKQFINNKQNIDYIETMYNKNVKRKLNHQTLKFDDFDLIEEEKKLEEKEKENE